MPLERRGRSSPFGSVTTTLTGFRIWMLRGRARSRGGDGIPAPGPARSMLRMVKLYRRFCSGPMAGSEIALTGSVADHKFSLSVL
jgi:hypothetical protein